MRLAPPPPNRCVIPVHEHTELLRSLAVSMAALERHETKLATALAVLGDIDLPAGAPNELDRAQLEAAGPLYFASELEVAGLLPAAELIAGLFASGAITQPLGPTAQLLHAFWKARRERLDTKEREAIFARIIEVPHFDRMMAALCSAIVALADGGDLRERVQLETASHLLGEFLAQRVDPMAVIAARDVVSNINTAVVFMRDRLLQTAFGVRSLWALVAAASAGTRTPLTADAVLRHVDQGRSGQTVLLWVAAHGLDSAPLIDAESDEGVTLIGAAQRWLTGRTVAAAPRATPALPIAV